MTLSDINSRISFLTKSDTTSYPNADRLIALNIWQDKIVDMIYQSNDEWTFDDSNQTDFPIATSNLVALQQDYSVPSDILSIDRIEVTYDGSNWFKAEPFTLAESGKASDVNTVKSVFSETCPYYAMEGNSIFLYPIPQSNVTGGIKIWYERTAKAFTLSDLTTGTLVPGFARSFHDMLSLGVAFDYNSTKYRDYSLAQSLGDMEVRLRKYYGGRQEDRMLSMKPAFINYR